jgi:hypothetical protein
MATISVGREKALAFGMLHIRKEGDVIHVAGRVIPSIPSVIGPAHLDVRSDILGVWFEEDEHTHKEHPVFHDVIATHEVIFDNSSRSDHHVARSNRHS